MIVTLPVRYKVISGSAQADKIVQSLEHKTTETWNLSKGGMGLVGAESLSKGDLLKVEITLPGTPKPLKTFAEVKWCRHLEKDPEPNIFRAGISFMAFRHEDDKLLDEYVSRSVKL